MAAQLEALLRQSGYKIVEIYSNTAGDLYDGAARSREFSVNVHQMVEQCRLSAPAPVIYCIIYPMFSEAHAAHHHVSCTRTARRGVGVMSRTHSSPISIGDENHQKNHSHVKTGASHVSSGYPQRKPPEINIFSECIDYHKGTVDRAAIASVSTNSQ